MHVIRRFLRVWRGPLDVAVRNHWNAWTVVAAFETVYGVVRTSKMATRIGNVVPNVE